MKFYLLFNDELTHVASRSYALVNLLSNQYSLNFSNEVD